MFPSALADGGPVMYPFTDKETEALGGEANCPGSRGQAVAQPALEPDSSTLGAPRPVFFFFETACMSYRPREVQSLVFSMGSCATTTSVSFRTLSSS